MMYELLKKGNRVMFQFRSGREVTGTVKDDGSMLLTNVTVFDGKKPAQEYTALYVNFYEVEFVVQRVTATQR